MFKVVLSSVVDPTSYDGEETGAFKRVEGILAQYPDGTIDFRLTETDHGIGAGWETITLEILSIATTIFFGLPALHKKIKDSIAGWKNIKKDVDSLVSWLKKKKEYIASYSKEVAFFEALEQLEPKTEVQELEFYGLIEIPGKNTATETTFETTGLYYYLFLFKEDNERLFVLLYDSQLRLRMIYEAGLDYRFLDEAGQIINIEAHDGTEEV
jgi:hypothetical protein